MTSEIKSWLLKVLKNDDLQDLSVNILGNSEKGDGYMGDVVFVDATGKTKENSSKEYNLVLKCSKRSQALRESMPVEKTFLTEMSFYNTVIPTFVKFQKDRGVCNPFNSIPKCYGTFRGENMEVIVLENLKKNCYDLWPKRNPVTRKHLEMVVSEYGKFHAISVAMKEQQLNTFNELVDLLGDLFKEFAESTDFINVFGKTVDETYELLKNDLDENILMKWKDFKKQVHYVLIDMFENIDGLKVIIHGDCWNNNFMYKFENGNPNIPLKVAILDWQAARCSSPIVDLSYYIFACISKKDLQNLDDILIIYYRSFADQLKQLGVNNPDVLYPFQQFLDEWKKYCKFGVMVATLIMKICATDKNEVVDVAHFAEKGEDISNTFLKEIKDKDTFRNRIRPIVEYAVKNDLI